jgi:hypothetical protein
MNEISSGVAFGILEKWSDSSAQLQVSVYRAGKSQGTPAVIISTDPGSEKIVASILESGQPAKWNLPLHGSKFSFGVPSEDAPYPEFAEGKWVAYLVADLPGGETIVFSERFVEQGIDSDVPPK